MPEKDRAAFLWAILEKQFLNIEPSDLKGMAKLAYISQQHSINQQVKGYIDKTKTLCNPLTYLPTEPLRYKRKGRERERKRERKKREVGSV